MLESGMPRYDAILVKLVSVTRCVVVENQKVRLRLNRELMLVASDSGVYKRQHNEQTPRLSVDPYTLTIRYRNT